ncbi:phosphotransferase family protein [Nocardia brasiliensis]|uniref:phosphotransferase family protein n=1 Tax=Nocardia brasiliensis TaxID=37326 RepID=UPI002453AFEB|nr:aminoglycoside phosphotransferase family protein [Nocardia brasiliensis]
MIGEPRDDSADDAFRWASLHVGLDPNSSKLLRRGENSIYLVEDYIVVRVSRPGQERAARREVKVAEWLETADIPAVQLAPGIDQPVVVEDRAVTFWRKLPPHRPGTPTQVAYALKQLHSLAVPTTFELGTLEPFVRLEQRIHAATTLPYGDREWMREHLVNLIRRYADLPPGQPQCVVHGDAWVGNVVATDADQVVLLDLERTSFGPPEWDLVHTAIKCSSFGWITPAEYESFCAAYGHDVTTWSGFELLRDVREFRMTCMAAQNALTHPADQKQAEHRLDCLQGKFGPRPWAGWRPLS